MNPAPHHPTPYTLHPRPCTPHPTPYTLHPTPYTLHPTPYTQHAAHYTPHPTPSTLHHTPYTIHPKPPTLHPQTSTPTLNPQSQTLHFKPGYGRAKGGVGGGEQRPWSAESHGKSCHRGRLETRCPSPETINPKFQSLDQHPKNLNTKHETWNPEPQIRNLPPEIHSSNLPFLLYNSRF